MGQNIRSFESVSKALLGDAGHWPLLGAATSSWRPPLGLKIAHITLNALHTLHIVQTLEQTEKHTPVLQESSYINYIIQYLSRLVSTLERLE